MLEGNIMWKSFILWLHHLFNPHCQECILENEARVHQCNKCECLERELSIAHQRIDQLIEFLHPQETTTTSDTTNTPQPIRSRFVPWSVKRQQLEHPKPAIPTVEDLEEELGINNG